MFDVLVATLGAILCSTAIFFIVWETTVCRAERRKLEELLVQFTQAHVQFSLARAESDNTARQAAAKWAQLIEAVQIRQHSAEKERLEAEVAHAKAAAELADAIKLLVSRQHECQASFAEADRPIGEAAP
ncbi:hypothetical protein WMF30_37270 [Sorangium sp. So ce134]